jgi:hypothetical protein
MIWKELVVAFLKVGLIFSRLNRWTAELHRRKLNCWHRMELRASELEAVMPLTATIFKGYGVILKRERLKNTLMRRADHQAKNVIQGPPDC